MRRNTLQSLWILSATIAGCAGVAPGTGDGASGSENEEATARAEIQAQLDRCVEATRIQDIETYMSCIPDDWTLKDESGAVVSRDELRQNVLRDWSIIPKTIAIETKVDSVELNGSAATVYTSQRWERQMLERDGKTIDHVVTTQKHRESWRHTGKGWMNYGVEEVGGEVWVNGEPYEP